MKAIQRWPSCAGKGKSHPCQSRSQALELCSKTKRAAGAKSCSTKVYDDRHKSSSCNVLLALALENSHSVAQPLQMTARAKEAVALLEYGGERHSARSIGNKYELISKWLLTGLAVVLSRPNWNILAKKGTLTSTPRDLLRRYYQQGHPADLVDKALLPHALPRQNAITAVEWQHIVTWFSHPRYIQDTDAVNAARSWAGINNFYPTMDQTNPIRAAQEEAARTDPQAEQTVPATSAASGP